MSKDCDQAYDELHGQQETPSQFTARLARGKLTEEEQEAMKSCTTDNERFAVTHPDYVSRDAFRLDWFRRQEEEQQPAAITPIPEDADDE